MYQQKGFTGRATYSRRISQSIETLVQHYRLNNCLWELEAALDLDGFGGGNGKNATATDFGSQLQRAALHWHAENLNPFLPTVTIGMDIPGASTSTVRQGSGAVGSQAEYDLHTANDGNNTGRAGNGVVFNWDDRSLTGIGIPGRISRFHSGKIHKNSVPRHVCSSQR